MRELTGDPFYGTYAEYGRCVIDYCLIADDAPYAGERSHRDAVLFAMRAVLGRDADGERGDGPRSGEEGGGPVPCSPDIGKAKAVPKDPAELLYVPKAVGRDAHGNAVFDCPMPDSLRGEQIPYWFAFLKAPHGTGCGPEDFARVNAALFPKGTDALEAYEWTTDWSDYFDDGREWWGTACWSVYDRRMDRYAVILASATD